MARRRSAADDTGAGALRRPGFLLGGGVVAVALIGAVITVLGSGDGGEAAAGPSAPPSQEAASGACRPTDTDQAIPKTAPAGVTWTLLSNIAIPASSSAGPMIVEGGVARCYAHTPRGALIAYMQIGVRSSFQPDWEQVVDQQMIPGPGRDAFRTNRAGFTPSTQPGTYMQTAGFRFVSYSPQTAVIQTVSRAADGGLWAATGTVVWAGDWKLQTTQDGKTSTPVEQVVSLEGFVPWGGV